MKWPDMRRWYIVSYDIKNKQVHLCRNTGAEDRTMTLDEPTLELMKAEYIRGQQETQGTLRKALGLK